MLCSLESKEEPWVLDSRTSFRATSQKRFFKNYALGNLGKVYLGNEQSCEIMGKGVVKIKWNGSVWELKNVKHFLDLTKNLISLMATQQSSMEIIGRFQKVNFSGCSAFARWCYGSVAFSVWHFGSAFCIRIAYLHLPALRFVSAALQLRCCGSKLVLQALFCKLAFALLCRLVHVAVAATYAHAVMPRLYVMMLATCGVFGTELHTGSKLKLLMSTTNVLIANC
ncbi:hypothetical protein KIW84_035478 [Lathyrus oleraceus]|uniref:Retrovirus-related Pol polyprotein from transposon TNT 1-94-like beta-barrel domain-containing protein n=1 Tax=Pisum sativum TaxID=3888 RepID=A0A9D5B620_PEA|nr:hypothetical protein KIW84_035478 [Pisum sativum]